ncbi:hypothetical protein [Pseudomonas sp.]|uniref:hypothetical protein n=1 Tax=Pseudomonas sp. TaxID=306 RepID=UPI00338D6574
MICSVSPRRACPWVRPAWKWTDPIIEGWESRGDVPKPYDSHSAGPEDALMLLHRDNRKWRSL